MSELTITRAEIIEGGKQEIDMQIEILRGLRDTHVSNSIMWRKYDEEIDRLLVEKDNLSLSVPCGWIEQEEAEKQENAEHYEMMRDLYTIGMGG